MNQSTANASAPTNVKEAVYQAENTADSMGGGAIKVIFAMIAKYKKRMWLSIFFGCLSSLMNIVPAIAVAYIVHYALNQNISDAIIWALIMIAASFAMVVFLGLSTSISHLIAADVQADQRHNIADKLKKVSLGFFTHTSSSDLRRILIDDIEGLEDGVAHLIPELTTAFFGPIILFIIMLFLQWQLAIVVLLPSVIGIVLMSLLFRKSIDISNRFYQAQANVSATMAEVVNSISVVKTYNNGDSALARAQNAIDSFKKVVLEFVKRSVVDNNMLFLFLSSNFIFVTPLSLYFLHHGTIGIPLFVFFNLAALTLYLLTSSILGLHTRLRKQDMIATRWKALMSQKNLNFVSEEAQQKPQNYDICFQDVAFSYDNKEILHGINFTVKAQTSLALVGPSGSGKTTVARLLARFWDLNRGTISIGGVAIDKMTPQSLSDCVSFVFQDVFLFSRSVKDNILLANPNASNQDVINAAKAAQAHDFITSLPNGYDTIISNNLSLSVGQKQRLSIARALLKNAPILVMDEATSFTDPENEHQVQKALSILCRDKTLIIIAHRLSTIQNADNIIYLKEGNITEQGRHQDLLDLKGDYYAQWQAHTSALQFQFSN